MSLPVTIQDGDGSKITQSITDDRAALTTNLTYPPFGKQKIRPFGAYLLSGGSEDMSVDGSATPVVFLLSAQDDVDVYITELSFALAYGASAYLYNFADSGAPLTNGIKISYTPGVEELSITQTIYKNSDLLRVRREPLTLDWQVRNFGAVNDWGFIGTIDLTRFIPPFGLKLDRGSKQELRASVRDDLTGFADLFNIFARGFERFEV